MTSPLRRIRLRRRPPPSSELPRLGTGRPLIAERPLHVGLFTDTYLPQINGIVTSVQGLAKGLREAGHRVTVVAPSHPQQTSEDSVLRLRATVYPPIPEQRMVLPPSPRAWTRLARARFDVIHTHGAFPMVGLVTARMLGLPLLHTYHTRMRDYIHYYPWYPYLASLSKESRWYMTPRSSARVHRILDSRSVAIGGRFDAWFANRCEVLVTPTDIIKGELLALGIRTPIHIIPNGIDLSSLRTPRPDPFLALGFERGARLLTVSRLAKEKSVDALLERFASLLERRPDASLTLLGDGPARADLERLAQFLGVAHRVRFVGYVPNREVGAFYQHADAFVFASTTETHGMVVLEAAACGLPCVAVKAGGIAASVPDGVAGFLAPEGDGAVFVRKALELLEPQTRARLSSSARAWAEAGSLETMAAQMLECYFEALGTFRREQLEQRLYSEHLLG